MFADKDLSEVEQKVDGVPDSPDSKPEARMNPFEERHKLLQMSEISLWLDTYDDIFSDFDPRPYSQRSLSDDFLMEAKKASKEKTSGRIELRFLIPKGMRNVEQEVTIKRRLHEHFKKHYEALENEVSANRRRSVFGIAIGTFMMIGATYISTKKSTDFIYNLLVVVLEPGGWFVTWFALDQLFYAGRQQKQDLEFYKKMSRCDIEFLPY
jgi:hypothetical protein